MHTHKLNRLPRLRYTHTQKANILTWEMVGTVHYLAASGQFTWGNNTLILTLFLLFSHL